MRVFVLNIFLIIFFFSQSGFSQNLVSNDNLDASAKPLLFLEADPSIEGNSQLDFAAIEEVDVYIDEKGNCRVFVPIPNSPEPRRAFKSTGVYVLAGITSMGILAAMPEDVTNWDKDELKLKYLASKWKENVSEGPVIDKDTFFLNWVMHPYFGSVYYETLRGAGYKWWESFLYSSGMSTIFWEYGLESLAETPSLQDLIITPVVGSAMGEGLFRAKIAIKNSGDEVLRSRFLGRTTLFLIDPLNEFQDIFVRSAQKRHGGCASFQLSSNPSLVEGYPGLSVHLAIQ